MFLYAFVTGIVPDSCNTSNGSVSIADYWNQSFRDTLNKITWTWSNGQTGLKANNLKAGVKYWVKGSFGNGCRYFKPHLFQDSFCIADINSPVQAWKCFTSLSINEDTLFFSINNKNTLNVDIEVVQKPLCSSPTGIIKAVVVEPFTPPLSFRWSTDEISEQLSDLSSSQYELYVVDNQGCRGKAITILQADFPPDYQITTSILNIDSCNLGIGKVSASVVGGFPPYTYQWNQGSPSLQSTFYQAQGTTLLMVRDSQGCEKSKSIYITNKNPLNNLKTGALLNCLATPGKITVETTGGVMP